MKETWKLNHGVTAMECGEKLILFWFDTTIDRDWVFKNQPWQFEGSLFAMQKFIGGNDLQLPSSIEVSVDRASFWARLYDVPISFMNETSLRHFVEHIGGILESVDRSGEDSVGRFMRFKMHMDITKPLVRGITIRVKGEVLWLPLKYEELPIYCFCCGTIGHYRKNCHSLDRNMEYGFGLNAPHLEIRKSHPPQYSSKKPKPTTLPIEIIENILSRLPTKYLHRFKAISKQWKETISDPRFAEKHLHQSKNSSSRNLLSWEVDDLPGYLVGEIQNDEIKFVSAVKHEGGDCVGAAILCYCDGLYLKAIQSIETYEEKTTYEEITTYVVFEEKTTYVVWNPCSRTYRKFQCPYPIHYNLHGICYDPLTKDYKVVLADMKHYAVFSCRYNKWSEMKEFCCGGDGEVSYHNGVSFNGCYYWIINFEGAGVVEFEIYYLDSRDERLKKLDRPHCVEKLGRFSLTCFRGHLCLFINVGCGMRMVKIVEGDEGDSWMELKLESPYYGSCTKLRPRCIVNENEIIFYIKGSAGGYELYDLRKDAFRKIRARRILRYSDPVPYQENLFLL